MHAIQGHLPDVHFLRYRLITDHLWSHPGHRTSKGHLSALITQLFGCPKVGDLHGIVMSD